MDFTFELSKAYSVIPFEILKQDKDEVIMLLNYMSEKSETAPAQRPAASGSAKYVKVNDRTATGGWW